MNTIELLRLMLKTDRELYEKILDTPNFAYYFNQLTIKARAYDNMIESN